MPEPTVYGLKCGELGPGLHDFVRAEDYEELEGRIGELEGALAQLMRSAKAYLEPGGRKHSNPAMTAARSALATSEAAEGEKA